LQGKEKIPGMGIKFDLFKGKNYKTGWRKICMDGKALKTSRIEITVITAADQGFGRFAKIKL
jgi:hypothetical protein